MEAGALLAKLDNHSAAVSAARDADGGTRLFFRALAVVALGLLLFGIVLVVTNRNFSPEPSSADVAPTPNSVARPSAGTAEIVSKDSSVDHELREDGRVYSVALIAATSEIPVGEKLFAQGRLESFDYESGLRSRPLAIIQDVQQPTKTLVCAMTADEGAEVVSLYHVGEVVAVSGDYIATASLNGYPIMPIIRDCRLADSQNNVVRPAAMPTPPLPDTRAEASVLARSTSTTTQSAAEQKPIPRVTYLAGACEDQILNPDDTWNRNNPHDVLCTVGVEDLNTLQFYQLTCSWGPADTSKWPATPCSWPLPHEFNLVTTTEKLPFVSGSGKHGHIDCPRSKYGCLLLDGSIWTVYEPTLPWIGWGPPKTDKSADAPHTATTASAPAPPAPAPPLRFESGVRLFIHLVSIERQPDGSFSFQGTLLLPLAREGAAPLEKGTILAGSGTVDSAHSGHFTVSVRAFVVQGVRFPLQGANGASQQPGTGPGIGELEAGKVLEMWFSSASVYESKN